MNPLPIAPTKRTLKPAPQRHVDVHNLLVKKMNVRYRCPNNTDYVFSCTPDEIIPQNMYCNGCGKKHSWTPELTDSDLAVIDKIRAEARENATLLDAVEGQATYDANSNVRPTDHENGAHDPTWKLNLN